MVLDMYAMYMNEAPDSPVDFKVGNGVQLHYWRKHPNLHGWMEKLYRAKGGSAESFNCAPVILTLRNLDALEADILAGALPYTEGFFFGKSDGTEIEDDLDFIANARDVIADGYTVYYDSWW